MDKAKEYYLGKGFNCAESILRAANEEYGLGLDEKALGAKMLTEGRSADCPGFREKCAGYYRAFEEALGSSECRVIGPKYKNGRCYTVVEKAYELLRTALEETKE